MRATPVLTAILVLSGCASEVDFSTLRRDQRLLYRRLADTRADVDRLSNEVSRLRSQMDDMRYRRGTGPSSTSLPPPGSDFESGSTSSITPPPPPPSSPPGYGSSTPGYGSGSTTSAPPYGGTSPTYGNWPGDASRPPSDMGRPMETTPSAEAPPQTSGANIQNDIAQASNAEYREGLERYSSGDYQRSAQSLRNFVAKNPQDSSIPVAHYWIGESYFAQGKYNEAILAYNEILVSYPKNERVPAALLRQGNAFAQTGDKIDARMIFQKLIEEHPNSAEAARAKEELRALGG